MTRTTRKLIAGALLAAFAPAAPAAESAPAGCTAPARGVMDVAMRNEATWTRSAAVSQRVQLNGDTRVAKTEIAWKAPPRFTDNPAHHCLRFHVELLLHPDVAMFTDATHDGSTTATVSSAAKHAEFAVNVLSHLHRNQGYQASLIGTRHHKGESHEYRMVLRVSVNGRPNNADAFYSRPDGGHHWHYEVFVRTSSTEGLAETDAYWISERRE